MSLRVYQSIGELFLSILPEHGNRPYLMWRDEVGQVQHLTFLEIYDRAELVAAGLVSLGFNKGDHLAIASETRVEWFFTDLGNLGLGGVTVTIYPSLTAEQYRYIIEDSESKVVFVDDKEDLAKVLEVRGSLPGLEYVFFYDELSEKDLFDLGVEVPRDSVHHVSWLLDRGREFLADKAGFLESAIGKVEEGDLASIIYTSGTTGVPKGVMLSHRNFLSDAIIASEIIKKIDPKRPPHEQNALTFMPLSHSYCRTSEEFVALYNGACLCLAGGRSPAIIETGFKVFKPSLMAGIPYVYEKIVNKVLATVKTYPPKIQKLFHKALAFGKKYNRILASGQKPSLGQRLHFWLDKKLVHKKIHQQLGGRLMGFASGSARLPPEISEFFFALGIRMIEGYGLTETTPITHMVRTWENSDFRPNWPKGKKIHPLAKLGSVGPPLEIPDNPYPNVECKIAEDGEVLIRGPNVMLGYWKKPEETAATIEPDGWLHTGDLGRVDEDGYLFITGRKKVIVKLSTGKMISPALVEDKLTLSPLLLQVILVGSDRKYLTALVVPDQNGVREVADEMGVEYSSYQDLIRDEKVLQAIKREILARSKDLAAYETVKKFAVLGQELSEEEGYLTPTLKYKRSKILEDFQDVIDEIYATDRDWVVVERRLVDFHDLTIPG
ncbi:MAG: AMP-dependent synthetase/ligase [Promethearchaeota archaeon]